MTSPPKHQSARSSRIPPHIPFLSIKNQNRRPLWEWLIGIIMFVVLLGFVSYIALNMNKRSPEGVSETLTSDLKTIKDDIDKINNELAEIISTSGPAIEQSVLKNIEIIPPEGDIAAGEPFIVTVNLKDADDKDFTKPTDVMLTIKSKDNGEKLYSDSKVITDGVGVFGNILIDKGGSVEIIAIEQGISSVLESIEIVSKASEYTIMIASIEPLEFPLDGEATLTVIVQGNYKGDGTDIALTANPDVIEYDPFTEADVTNNWTTTIRAKESVDPQTIEITAEIGGDVSDPYPIQLVEKVDQFGTSYQVSTGEKIYHSEVLEIPFWEDDGALIDEVAGARDVFGPESLPPADQGDVPVLIRIRVWINYTLVKEPDSENSTIQSGDHFQVYIPMEPNQAGSSSQLTDVAIGYPIYNLETLTEDEKNANPSLSDDYREGYIVVVVKRSSLTIPYKDN